MHTLKQILILCLLWTVGIVANASLLETNGKSLIPWDIPTYTGAELQYSTIGSDTTMYYIYNEEAGVFYTNGNDWNTRASVSPCPSAALKTFFVKFIDSGESIWDGTSINVYNYVEEKGGWNNLFIEFPTNAYVDHANQKTTMIFGTEKNGNAYRLYANGRKNLDTTSCWDRESYPTHYFGIDLSKGDSVLYPLLNMADASSSNYLVDFKLVPITDKAFMGKCEIYYASVLLAATINRAMISEYASSIDKEIDEAIAVYNNHNSTISELNTATHDLFLAMREPFYNEIWYTASEKLTETTYSSSSGLHTNAFNTSISSHTFSNGKGIIKFSGNVTSIGDYAFFDCSGLTSITIPNSVKSIGYEAFRRCSGLTSITIPNSVTSIEGCAFTSCDGLTSITIGNSVTSIGTEAFHWCSGLKSITIPNSVTSIGYQAFTSCSGLTSVTIGNSVTIIGYYAFDGCSNVKQLIYAEGTTNLLRTSLTSITSVVIPNSVTSIGDGLFQYCSNLKSITIPNSVMTIGDDAFEGCTSLPVENNIRYADTYLVESIDKTQSTYTIKEGTKWIGPSAFSGCSGFTSITIPNSVTSIGYKAFDECSGLTSIAIPNSVTSIGDLAFYGCSGLKSVSIGNSVKSIGSRAFSGCSGLTSITIGNSVTSIGGGAFSGCSGLTSITIPNSVTSIGNYAFQYCSGLASIIIGNSVKSIGEYAFYGCSGLTSITIPNSVTSIGNYAFQYCSGLASIIIGNSVTSIGSYAFRQCSGLKSITIGNSVTSMGTNPFKNCSSLESIIVSKDNPYFSDYGCNVIVNDSTHELITGCNKSTIPNSVTRIGQEAFYWCSGLTSLTIPNSVTSIGEYAFSNCNNVRELIYSYGATRVLNLGLTGLTSVTLPKTITTIDTYAFSGCYNLQTLDIPKSVTSIGTYAFQNMYSLKTMYVHWDEPLTVAANILSGASTSSATLYVPSSAVDAYKAAPVWKNFGTITFSGEEPYNFLAIDKNGNEIKKEVEAYDDITLRDTHKSLTITEEISNVNVTYKRTFPSSNWQCWYMPFDLELTNSILNDFSFAEVEGAVFQEDGTPYIAFVKLGLGDIMKANTPYVIKAKYPDSSSEQSISADGVTLKKTADKGFSINSSRHIYTFSGFYAQKTKGAGESWYAINNSGSFQQPAEGVVINPFRFSMTITNRSDSPYPAKALPSEVKIRIVGEEATNIDFVETKSEELMSVNLAGQQVSKDFKGIVIKNGKKYLNR